MQFEKMWYDILTFCSLDLIRCTDNHGGTVMLDDFRVEVVEARYAISSHTAMKDIEQALQAAGAVRRRWYALRDTMFAPIGAPTDYNRSFVRLREARTPCPSPFPIILTHKETAWGPYAKIDNIVVRHPFNDMESAQEFIERYFGGTLIEDFRFLRRGREYALGGLRLFLELILDTGAWRSIEIEGASEEAIAACASELGLGEPLRSSVPTLVQRRLQASKARNGTR